MRKTVAYFDAIDGVSKTLRGIESSVGRFEVGTLSAFGRVEKGVAGLLSSASALRNVSGIIAGGFGVNMATEFIDSATRIHNALRSIGADSEDTFNQIFLAATRSLTSMDGFTAGVMRLHKVMADRQTVDQSIRQIETLNKLLALGGKSTTERESTLLQFTQALQAGALQGDEMRALRENAPVEFLREIARLAGGTTADLKRFSMEAKITTAVMVEALDNLASEADRRIGQVTLTIADGANALRNGALVATESFDKGSGLSRAVTETLQTIGTVLGSSAEAAEMFGKAMAVAAAIGVAGFAGQKATASINWLKAYREGLHQAVIAAKVEAKETAAAATAATAARDKRLAAVAAIQAKQDAYVASVKNTTLEEAKSATAARSSAQIKVAATEQAIAAQKQELAVMEKAIAAESRRRSNGILGVDRRDVYGDATVVSRYGGMTDDEFTKAVAARTAAERKLEQLDRQRIASEKTVTIAVEREAATRTALSGAEVTAAQAFAAKTDAQRQKAMTQLAAAEGRLIALREAEAVATNAVTAATARLTLAARANAMAARVMSGAWAFLGGWPGMLLLAGFAFMSMNTQAEAFAATMQRAGDATNAISGLSAQYEAVTDEIEADTKRLKSAHEDVAEAIRSQGVAATDAKALEVQAIEARIAKNKELLASITAVMAANLQTAQQELRSARASFENTFGGEVGAKANYLDPSIQDDALAAYEAAVDRKIAAGLSLTEREQEFVKQRLALAQQEVAIADQKLALQQTMAGLEASHAARAEAGHAVQRALSDEAQAAYDKRLADLTQEADIAALIAKHGAGSVEVTQARAEAERAAYQAALATDGITGEFAARLMEVYDTGKAFAEVDMKSGVAAAASSAAELAKSMGISLDAAKGLLAQGYEATKPVTYDPRDPNYDAAAVRREQMAAERERLAGLRGGGADPEAGMAALASASGDAGRAVSEVLDAQTRLNEVIASGAARSKADQAALAATLMAELAAKQALLALENNRLVALQAMRQAEIDRLQASVAADQAAIAAARAAMPADTSSADGWKEAVRLNEVIAEAQARIEQATARAAELKANFVLTGVEIDRNNAMLSEAGAALTLAAAKSGALAGALQSAVDVAARLAESVPGGDWLSGAIRSAASLVEKLAAAVGLKNALMKPQIGASGTGTANVGPGQPPVPEQPVGWGAPATGTITIDINGGGGGGGGGGGRSEADAQEEALRYIEQMMTAEERRAKEMAEMVAVRERLVATYGPEAEIVAQMDEAIRRARDGVEELDNAYTGFFDSLSDKIAASMENWSSWGDLIRSILADIVRQNGVDFFTSILTPGAQSGGGLGTIIGNKLTGNAAMGAVTSPAKALTPESRWRVGEGEGSAKESNATVPDMKAPQITVPDMKAPQITVPDMKALWRDASKAVQMRQADVTSAIRQSVDVARLKAGQSPMIPTKGQEAQPPIAIHMPVDMRGADEAMKPYIDARMKQMEREFPGRVVDAVQRAQKSRRL